jgi:hypothetical protein
MEAKLRLKDDTFLDQGGDEGGDEGPPACVKSGLIF